MSDIPSLREEVNRKCLETLQKLHDDYTLGKINNGQYKYAIDICWSLVAGLIDDGNRQIIEQFSRETTAISYSEKSYFRNEEGLVVVIIDSKAGLLLFKLIKQGEKDKINTFDFREEQNPTLAAKNKLVEIVQSISNKGFVRL